MSEIEFQPEGVKLLVKLEKIKEKSEGGIFLAPKAREEEQYATVRGEVVAIGPRADVKFDGGPLEVGDTVIFAKYGGNIVEDKNLDGIHRILNDEDVFIRVRRN